MNESNAPRVLVGSASSRKSLAVVRALGKHGLRVDLISRSLWDPSRYSRYVDKVIHQKSNNWRSFYPRELYRREISNVRFVRFFLEEAEIEDHYTLAKDSNVDYFYLLPNKEDFEVAYDKSKTNKHATGMKVAVIPTIEIESIDELYHKERLDSLKYFEIVTKPACANGSQGVRYFSNISDVRRLQRVLEEDLKQYGKILIQQRIDRHYSSIGVGMLFDQDGDCINSFVHKRLNQFPITGGPSTRRVSILNEILLNESKRLMRSLNWRGLVMVEWFFDEISGKYYLVEINPRPWGSISLPILCGQNFPVRYYHAALGENLLAEDKYDLNRINRWLLPGDCLRWIYQKEFSLHSFKNFMEKSLSESEEWDNSDRVPFLMNIVQIFFMLFDITKWNLLKSKTNFQKSKLCKFVHF